MTALWTSLAIAGAIAVSIVVAFLVYILWVTGGDVTGWTHKMDELTASLDRARQELQACHEGQPCPVSRRNGCERCADKLAAYRLVKRDAFGTMPRSLIILGTVVLALRWLRDPLSFEHLTVAGFFGICAVSLVAGAITAHLGGHPFGSGLATGLAVGCLAGASFAPPGLPVRRRRPPKDDPS